MTSAMSYFGPDSTVSDSQFNTYKDRLTATLLVLCECVKY